MRGVLVSPKRRLAGAWMLLALGVFVVSDSLSAQAASVPEAALESGLAPQVMLPVTFRFEDHITIEQDRLLLGAIAECQGNTRVCEEAYGVDLGASPAPGKFFFLRRDKILAALHNEWPDVTIRLEAPLSIKVVAAFMEVSADQILQALTEALNQLTTAGSIGGGYAITVEKVNWATPLKLRPGTFRLEFPTLAELSTANRDWLLKRWNGLENLEVTCFVSPDTDSSPELSGEEARWIYHFSVQTQFSVKQKLPVLKKSKMGGDILAADDFIEEWQIIGASTQGPVDQLGNLVGRRIKRSANAGTTVSLNQIEIPVVVERGQVVKLVIKQSGLTVASRVKTLAAGGYGQLIDAIYPDTKKRLRVKVIDAETVEYQF